MDGTFSRYEMKQKIVKTTIKLYFAFLLKRHAK